MDAYAFAPDGSHVPLPDMCHTVMNAMIERAKSNGDSIFWNDVPDRDGRPMRVIWTTLGGHVLYSFQF